MSCTAPLAQSSGHFSAQLSFGSTCPGQDRPMAKEESTTHSPDPCQNASGTRKLAKCRAGKLENKKQLQASHAGGSYQGSDDLEPHRVRPSVRFWISAATRARGDRPGVVRTVTGLRPVAPQMGRGSGMVPSHTGGISRTHRSDRLPRRPFTVSVPTSLSSVLPG
jgi:hypothetical protein